MSTTRRARARRAARGPASAGLIALVVVTSVTGEAGAAVRPPAAHVHAKTAGGEPSLLWSDELSARDIHSVNLHASAALEGNGVVLVNVRSRTAPPRVECRSADDGRVLWRRLPGGRSGEPAFVRAADPHDDDAAWTLVAGGVALTLDARGRVVASTPLPARLRAAAVGGRALCVVSAADGEAFGDSLVVFRRAGAVASGESRTAGDGRSGTSAGAPPVGWSRAWSLTLEDLGRSFDNGFSRPVFADVDADGRDELLVVERMNELVCLGGGGSERWRVTLGEKSRLKPVGVASANSTAADVTGDGIRDVVIGCFAGAVVVVDGELGEEVARLQFGNESHLAHIRGRRLSAFIREALASTGEPIAEILAVDLDGVSGEELVFGCSDGFVYAVSPRTGETLWRFEPGRDVYDRPVIEPARGPAPMSGAASLTGRPVRAARRLVFWDEECLYVLDARSGTELARLTRPCISTAAVLGWDEQGVEVVAADGLSGRLEAWRVPAPAQDR